MRFHRAIALSLIVALTLTTPGPQAVAAVSRNIVPQAAAIPTLPTVGTIVVPSQGIRLGLPLSLAAPSPAPMAAKAPVAPMAQVAAAMAEFSKQRDISRGAAAIDALYAGSMPDRPDDDVDGPARRPTNDHDGSGDSDDLGNPRRDPDDDSGPDGRGGSDFLPLQAALPEAAQAEDAQAQKPVEYVVVLKKGARPLASDVHLSLINIRRRSELRRFGDMQSQMRAELEAAGVPVQTLDTFGASPIATYQRINAATLTVDAQNAAALRAWLEGLGHVVYDNGQREIIRPEDADPQARTVSMADNLRITKADKVQEAARARWGAPDMGVVKRALRWVFGEAIPQPLIGVIDTGAETTHPLLRRVKRVVNVTTGTDEDDNGHGTWVASMILNYAPWLKGLTAYKAFVNGGASLDDILKALTVAGNDGNIIISNSWGSNSGDPESPDSQLVRKLAEEGHILVFAAGNAGPGANTIGSPAIVQYRDANTGALRVLSVAASDFAKVIARFSSRGPGSRRTKGKPGYPQRPDLTGIGFNTEGAWLGGGLKAISGTSMSTPSIAGALAMLCMLYGVTARGDKLDAIVNAVMGALEKTGQGPDHEGQGFLNLEAASKALESALAPVAPHAVAKLTRKLLAGVLRS